MLELGDPGAAHPRTGPRVRAPGDRGGKRDDPRWPAFARRHGFDIEHPVQWEVEALEPDELQRLVLAAVDPYIDRDGFAREIAREEQQRRALEEFAGRWDAESGEQS
ncbi:hypothetical protein ACGFXC_33505 [Streptomyces sp. NPDC048507]|uniref:hypothetical protein n=1 Tax=Streptomyces sp. NPDC048507 TaxID=3365560 RepID=UPI0037230D2C